MRKSSPVPLDRWGGNAEKGAMFWLLKKLVTLLVIIGVVWFIFQLDYQGKPVSQRVQEFTKAPLVQEVSRQAKELVMKYLYKKKILNGPAMENLTDEEKKELDKVIKEKSK